jgi:catechol 2,3-dioxygenase-like lactoylglutathione lyase family enzyme
MATRVVPILRVADAARAEAFYVGTLGFAVEFRYAAGPAGPVYLGISLDGQQVHLSTFGGDSAIGAAVYVYVEDVDALFRRFQAAGFTTPGRPASPVEDSPTDQTWGMREFYLRDPDGNVLRFGSPLPDRPPA